MPKSSCSITKLRALLVNKSPNSDFFPLPQCLFFFFLLSLLLFFSKYSVILLSYGQINHKEKNAKNYITQLWQHFYTVQASSCCIRKSSESMLENPTYTKELRQIKFFHFDFLLHILECKQVFQYFLLKNVTVVTVWIGYFSFQKTYTGICFSISQLF